MQLGIEHSHRVQKNKAALRYLLKGSGQRSKIGLLFIFNYFQQIRVMLSLLCARFWADCRTDIMKVLENLLNFYFVFFTFPSESLMMRYSVDTMFVGRISCAFGEGSCLLLAEEETVALFCETSLTVSNAKASTS